MDGSNKCGSERLSAGAHNVSNVYVNGMLKGQHESCKKNLSVYGWN